VPSLVLLRHGQSSWNAEGRFTGWVDVDLTEAGEAQAALAGGLLAAESDLDVEYVHTSLLTRAVRTADIALAAMGRSWLPVQRSWRLNERHYGALQGLGKVETAERFGAEEVHGWRRGYRTPPPPLARDDPGHPSNDFRYRAVAPGALPSTECLADVVARAIPYFEDAIAPELLAGSAVLVVAHGNSIRALAKFLENISDEAIVDLEIPTGIPRRYDLGRSLEVRDVYYLGNPDDAARAAEAVALEAG